jgi:3-oxoacyl-[acyl-carrier-protein] synthase III
MGELALRQALQLAKVDVNDLSFVLSTGMSRDYLPSWSVAAEWMKNLGAPEHCWPLDITSGCMGSLVGLELALATLAMRGGGYGAIGAAEKVSYTIDRSKGEKNALWGLADGAGAAIVSLNRSRHPRAMFYGAEFISMSALNGTVLLKYGGTRHPSTPAGAEAATRELTPPPGIDLRSTYISGYTAAFNAMYARFDERPDSLICNQISDNMVKLIGQAAGVAPENVTVTGHETGHVGSADILIGLHRHLANGYVSKPITIAASTPYVFGAGLLGKGGGL